MGNDHDLRQLRLVFYEQDVDRLDGELDGFLELSGARCALLIDREGHLVTRRGEVSHDSLESISALIAGSFAATREMARLLGEEEFTTLLHQGLRDSIHIALVGERSLFATVFDERTNLGMVKFYAQETTRKLQGIMHELVERERSGDGSITGLASDFSTSAAAALDELF